MKLLDNQHTRLLAKSMDVYALRQKITAANVANIDTPGYRKQSVSFEEELKRAAGSMGGRDLHTIDPKIEESEQAPILEEELLEMADTQVRVQLVTRALRQNFDLLRTGITGRNR